MILREARIHMKFCARSTEKKHCLTKGGELDLEKTAALFLDDFRGGKLGRLTLEFPEDYR